MKFYDHAPGHETGTQYMKKIKTRAQLEDVVRAMCETSINIALAAAEGESTSSEENMMMNLWDRFDNLVEKLES